MKVDFDFAVMEVDFNIVMIFAWRSSWVINSDSSSDGLSVFVLSPIIEGRIILLVFFELCLTDPIRIVSEYVVQYCRVPFSTLG